LKFILGCKPGTARSNGKRVAIVGAGVAGLGAAGYLYCRGYDVDVYDAMPEAGGLLMFGIPEERIPKKGVLEGINELRAAGVRFTLNTKVGDELLEKIIESHDATLLATGTWKARRMEVPGSDLEGVMSALDVLVTNSLYRLGFSAERVVLGGKIAIIGGGFTAVDAAVESLKWSEDVSIFYRRTVPESEAHVELQRIRDRGVKVTERVLPRSFLGTKRVERMELWDVDMKGNSLSFIQGSAREVPVDFVLLAIGEERTPPFSDSGLGIKAVSGKPIVDAAFMTTRPSVFAAGDLVDGPSSIGNALSSGLKAARSIDSYLQHA